MLTITAGVIILLLTIVLLIKKQDTRTVLLFSGMLMCLISLEPMAAMNSFAEKMVSEGLIQAILSAIGFATVMKFTGCDRHLVRLLSAPLKHVGLFLIPGTILLTTFVQLALPSAAGAAAAAGITMIPLQLAAGIHPVMAAASVLAGTFGASLLNPGSPHMALVAKIVGGDVMNIIGDRVMTVVWLGLIIMVGMTITAILRKEHKGYHSRLDAEDPQEGPINVLAALMPLVPIALLMLGAFGGVSWLKMGVPQAVMWGVLATLAVTRTHPGNVVPAFFDGMGKAYSDVFGIIICAGVFVAGLTSVGLIDAAKSALIDFPEAARFGGTIGPFLMAVVIGSGDATAYAFNEAITPHAAEFGMNPTNLGTAAAFASYLGRTASPLSAAAIVVAGMAGVSPIELIKRTAPVMLIGLVLLIILI
ncbi:C4-dicarboxylate transporter DcuC [Hafnia sp. HMSC23F03]|uniref:C4-dicarboxylate transporter DcuC n=1 Tax=Hafnia sp. HMSC23F03 TaxID=1581059 RepID=UPI0008A5CF4F|nr:C4-dicarboxylate transporter DcuC [Hafnia sp. HMSC23F03]OFS08268.1 C4-dicarboxylate ABC transporter [Hafnia sp. HMSC23F03]